MRQSANSVMFEVAGKVEAKGRGRVGSIQKANGQKFSTVFTPAHTRKYEALVRHAAGQAMGEREPFDKPVEVRVLIFLAIPQGKQKQFEKYGADLLPETKPDIDNYVKAALDAINTIVITDDKLVWSMTARKLYSNRPRMRVEVRLTPTAQQLKGLD